MQTWEMRPTTKKFHCKEKDLFQHHNSNIEPEIKLFYSINSREQYKTREFNIFEYFTCDKHSANRGYKLSRTLGKLNWPLLVTNIQETVDTSFRVLSVS